MGNQSYMPVWPGPVVMVPVTTDILLIGKPDFHSATSWSSTKNNYYNLWMQMQPDQPSPFDNEGNCPDVGAHLMWTLPYSLRQGKQQADGNAGEDVSFPYTPNKWLVTRFEYPANGADYTPGNTPPKVTAKIVLSDKLFDISGENGLGGNGGISQYPDPANPSFPLKGIGGNSDLEQWDGQVADTPLLKAVGPGDVSWSVAYDNIKHVFSLHDPLGASPAWYTYSVIGWYDHPDQDVLNTLPVTGNGDWLSALESLYGWSVGSGVAEVQDAVDAWLAWQNEHGLSGIFDPSSIKLPPQAKAAIVAWHNWQQLHGTTGEKPPLPTQSIYHSQVNVLWKGDNLAYGTGVPRNAQGETLFPTVAVGNTAVEALAVYMATKVVKESGQSEVDIPVIERALIAFQKELLTEFETDPVKVETAIHLDRFELAYGGQEWVVVRPESSKENILATGGQQSIPLDEAATAALTLLNRQQQQQNDLGAAIQTQRQELFLLNLKGTYLTRHTPQALTKQVNQSMSAIQGALQVGITAYNAGKQSIDTAAEKLAASLGDNYVLKVVDLPPVATPTDPVIMIGGTQLDTKLVAPGEYDGNRLLPVRVTGQAISGITISADIRGSIQTVTIGAAELLEDVKMPAWNAIPKEALDLWVEALLLDTTCAAFMAKIYFRKLGITPTTQELAKLTQQIKTQQTAVWNDAATLGVHPQALGTVAGFSGVLPSPVGIAYVVKQPWTPVYIDWSVNWFPSANDPLLSLKDWQLDDIDYSWTGNSIPAPAKRLNFTGRTVLNAKTAQIIQYKFSTFESQPIYDSLPPYIIRDLQMVAAQIGQIDVLTQSMSGFNKQLSTQLMSMNMSPKDKNVTSLLGNTGNNFRPVLGTYTENAPYFPIRSGHFQLMDLQVVDAFGQVMRGKDPGSQLGGTAATPMSNVIWSENLVTSSPNYSGDTKLFGQLNPRLIQASAVKLTLLKNDDDTIPTNSADLTNPICGWIMPNHLDNSIMIFDANGVNLGAILKVQREVAGGRIAEEDKYTIRWDAVPGSNTTLGAPPLLPNVHLQSFVNSLLKTGFEGAGAYEDLVAAIDVTLWPMSNFKSQAGNQSVLLGRPLALVRSDVRFQLAGEPVYNQGWQNTGAYYNNNGIYKPVKPPFMSAPFPVRIGDSNILNNGVIGYFQADKYDTFYAVYGANGQTNEMLKMFSGGYARTASLEQLSARLDKGGGYVTDYVQSNHTVSLPPDNSRIPVTLLVDPSGVIPVIPGTLPNTVITLPNGPVSNALEALKATFRAGPLLLDPKKIKMPTPAEVQGNWGWMARKDVTEWNPEVPIGPYTPVATLEQDDLKLIEGWITLSGSNKNEKN